MQILIGLEDLDWAGQTTHAYYLSRAFARMGHQVLRVGGWTRPPQAGSAEPTRKLCGVKLPLAGRSFLSQAASPLRRQVAFRQQLAILRGLEVNLAVALSFGAADAFGHLLPDVPLITACPGSVVGFLRFQGRYAGRHGPASRLVNWCKRQQLRYLEAQVLRRSDAVVVESATARRQVLEVHPAAVRKIVIVPSGVDAEVFAPDPVARRRQREELQIPQDALVVAYTGRLAPEKNVEFLLQGIALADRPSLRGLIVGDGPGQEALLAQAAALGISSRVVFTGFRRDVPKLLATSDALVLPSRSESFGNSLLEGMAAGLACVATTGPWEKVRNGAAELVQPGQTGELVPWDQPEVLAELLAAWARNPGRCRRLGSNARQRAISRYNWLDIAHGYLVAVGNGSARGRRQPARTLSNTGEGAIATTGR